MSVHIFPKTYTGNVWGAKCPGLFASDTLGNNAMDIPYFRCPSEPEQMFSGEAYKKFWWIAGKGGLSYAVNGEISYGTQIPVNEWSWVGIKYSKIRNPIAK